MLSPGSSAKPAVRKALTSGRTSTGTSNLSRRWAIGECPGPEALKAGPCFFIHTSSDGIELRLLAERRLGEMIEEAPKAKGAAAGGEKAGPRGGVCDPA